MMCVLTSVATGVTRRSKSRRTMVGGFTSALANHAKTEWRLDTDRQWQLCHTGITKLFPRFSLWPLWTLCELILRPLELSEFFFRVRYVGFVCAAELQQSLLTAQIRFGKLNLGALA